MDLILWRHAEAARAEAGGDDLARALTPEGERQAARMAVWLGARLPARARVLASPARRAQQTAVALGRRFATADALAPGGTVEALLAAAGWPDAPHPVLVVGHQPTLGLALAGLMAQQARSWALRKGSLCWLRCRARDATRETVLRALIGLDLL
ncbi:MAG: histidine phosphatase family protein [Rubrivivax sp.]|jgi:phosphohistidine phosphatase|nr:histidine phosphatase family protein [Rubrivivax sp.]